MTTDATSTEVTERTDAVHRLEDEFSSLVTRFRVVIARNAELLSAGLQPGSYKVFTTIASRGGADDAGVTLSALADLLHLDKGHLSRAIRDLEERGLVFRTPDPDDGRASRLHAAPDAQRRLAEVRSQTRALADVTERWPIEDVRELTRLLRALHRDD